MEFKWERIEKAGIGYTERAKVFEGWVIRIFDSNFGSFSMVFVPDKNHEWTIDP